MKDWQFNVLFFVGVGGAVTLLFGPSLGLRFDQQPTALSGVGAILAYILTQKKKLTKDDDTKESKKESNSKFINKRTDIPDLENPDAADWKFIRQELERRLEEGDD